jgi:F-type H+-transporting ATPase subunit c
MPGTTSWRQFHKEEKSMKKCALFVLAVIALTLLAPAAFAAEGAPAEATNWIAITAGFSMAIASAGCGYAQSKATAAACEGMARNPGATAAIRFALILALVLIESMALYTFATMFIRVK